MSDNDNESTSNELQNFLQNDTEIVKNLIDTLNINLYEKHNLRELFAILLNKSSTGSIREDCFILDSFGTALARYNIIILLFFFFFLSLFYINFHYVHRS